MQVDGYSLDAQKEKTKKYADAYNTKIISEITCNLVLKDKSHKGCFYGRHKRCSKRSRGGDLHSF